MNTYYSAYGCQTCLNCNSYMLHINRVKQENIELQQSIDSTKQERVKVEKKLKKAKKQALVQHEQQVAKLEKQIQSLKQRKIQLRSDNVDLFIQHMNQEEEEEVEELIHELNNSNLSQEETQVPLKKQEVKVKVGECPVCLETMFSTDQVSIITLIVIFKMINSIYRLLQLKVVIIVYIRNV
jgi:chromosome segregation ATPase